MESSSIALAQSTSAVSRRHGVRMRTLVRIRWMAIAGQTTAVVYVKYELGFQVPLAVCLGLISASVLLNLILSSLLARQRMASPWEATIQLGYDIVQLSLLLGFTGGVSNPFVFFLIAPTTVAAAALPPKNTAVLSALTLACTCVLAFASAPLPWLPGELLHLPAIYRMGLLTAVITGVAFTSLYAWRVSVEEERLRTALFATEAVLAREQQVAALGGLAAAAAHELGTPLATIQVTAKEMVNELTKGSSAADDAQLILSQAMRCRDILKSLSSGNSPADAMHARMTLESLLRESAEPHMNFGVDVSINVAAQGNAQQATAPILTRRQEIVHALGAFVENAVSFADNRVDVNAAWSASEISVTIVDDGPGFSELALARLGEPFVSQREPDSGGGMGLGFFIAKTLVERSGGKIAFNNRSQPAHGAVVKAVWPRTALEASAV